MSRSLNHFFASSKGLKSYIGSKTPSEKKEEKTDTERKRCQRRHGGRGWGLLLNGTALGQ